jgi:hypothetical protein
VKFGLTIDIPLSQDEHRQFFHDFSRDVRELNLAIAWVREFNDGKCWSKFPAKDVYLHYHGFVKLDPKFYKNLSPPKLKKMLRACLPQQYAKQCQIWLKPCLSWINKDKDSVLSWANYIHKCGVEGTDAFGKYSEDVFGKKRHLYPTKQYCSLRKIGVINSQEVNFYNPGKEAIRLQVKQETNDYWEGINSLLNSATLDEINEADAMCDYLGFDDVKKREQVLLTLISVRRSIEGDGKEYKPFEPQYFDI